MLKQIATIDIARPEHFSNFHSTSVYCKLQFEGDKKWIPLAHYSISTIKYTSTTKKTDAGLEYTHKLAFSIPSIRFSMTQIAQLCNIDLIVRITYNDGECHILGTPDFPAIFTKKTETSESSIHKAELQCVSICDLLVLKS